MERLLIIDDDLALCELLKEYLSLEGFSLEFAHDVQSAADHTGRECFDLLVLDVMLPGGNGFEVLRKIRQSKSTPVIMLTARGSEVDRILGLEMGADDYLPKPFNPRELVARIKAVLRRSKGGPSDATALEKLMIGDLEIDVRTRSVICAGEEVDLTGVEFQLLEILGRNAGRIVARDVLAKEVLGRALTSFDRSIDVHISRIRKKLPQAGNGAERIKSIRSSGYIYTPTAAPGTR
jgi:two-component system, OmpR family, response regulator CpxR